MAEAHKLTEAQARLVADVLDGGRLVRGAVTRSFYMTKPGTGMMTVSGPMVERMIKGGMLQSTGRLDQYKGQIIALTDAGRAALARHRGETP